MTKKEQKKEQQPTQLEQQSKYSEIDKLRFEIRNLREEIKELNKFFKENFQNTSISLHIKNIEETIKLAKLVFDYNREQLEKLTDLLEKEINILQQLKDDFLKISEDLHIILVKEEEIIDFLKKVKEKEKLCSPEELGL